MTRRYFVGLGIAAFSLLPAAAVAGHHKHRRHKHGGEEDEDDSGPEKGEQKAPAVTEQRSAVPQVTEQKAAPSTQQKR